MKKTLLIASAFAVSFHAGAQTSSKIDLPEAKKAGEKKEIAVGASMLDLGSEHAIEERELFGIQAKYMFATPLKTTLGEVRGGVETSFATQNNVDANFAQRFDQDFFTLGFAQSIDFKVPGMLAGLTPSIDTGIGGAFDYVSYSGTRNGSAEGLGIYAKIGTSLRYNIEGTKLSPFISYSYTYTRMLDYDIDETTAADGPSGIGNTIDRNISINQLMMGMSYQF